MCYGCPIFRSYVDAIAFCECVIVFRSKTLRHESTVHPLYIPCNRFKKKNASNISCFLLLHKQEYNEVVDCLSCKLAMSHLLGSCKVDSGGAEIRRLLNAMPQLSEAKASEAKSKACHWRCWKVAKANTSLSAQTPKAWHEFRRSQQGLRLVQTQHGLTNPHSRVAKVCVAKAGVSAPTASLNQGPWGPNLRT